MNDSSMTVQRIPAEIQLVVFDVGNEVYGIDIAVAREIIRMQQVTAVPGAADFVEGVINLRGRVIPVLDLRKRLGVMVAECTEETRIVVVAIADMDVGVIVDAVTGVLRISNELVEPLPAMSSATSSGYLRGIAKLDDKLIILLDLDKVFAMDQGFEAAGIALGRGSDGALPVNPGVADNEVPQTRSDASGAARASRRKKGVAGSRPGAPDTALAGSRTY